MYDQEQPPLLFHLQFPLNLFIPYVQRSTFRGLPYDLSIHGSIHGRIQNILSSNSAGVANM